MTPTGPDDSFPRQSARTRRCTLGAPRTVTVGDDGLVRFCRSRGGADPVNLLWELDPATGEERVVIDPAELAVDERDLPEAERARRERAREAAGGVVTYAVEGDRIVTALAGRLVVADRVDGAWTVSTPPTAGPVFDPRPVGAEVAHVSGDALHLGDRVLCAEDGETISWGSAEFVAAEEMGRSRGYWVEPGGARLLVTRVDVAPVPVWWIASPAEPGDEPPPVRCPHAGAAHAAERGVLIADTKFEFGQDGGGRLYLIDEVLTPDSSRFWPADSYDVGISPPSFDKQYIRDYLEMLDWDKRAPGPDIPDDILKASSAKYEEALRRLTRA